MFNQGRFAGREGFFPKECVRLVREIGVSMAATAS